MIDLIDNIIPLLFHPSYSVRAASIELLASISDVFGLTYTAVFLLPKLWPNYLKYDIQGIKITSKVLSLALLSPINRRNYRQAILSRQVNTTQYSIISINNNYTKPLDVRESEAFGINGNIMDSRQSYIIPYIKQPNNENVNATENLNPKNIEITESSNENHLNARLHRRFNIIASELTNKDIDDENKKLSIISKYLDRVAQEITTKSKQWKTINNNNNNAGRISRMKDKSSNINLDSLLDVTLNNMPDHSIQSFLVPHQKYGIGMYSSLTEDLRNEYMNNPKHLNSINRIKKFYGIISRSADVNRSLQNEMLPIINEDTSYNSFSASTLQQPPSSPTKNSNNNNIASIDSTILLKRINALDIPPIPPDLGSLVQPDERKYK